VGEQQKEQQGLVAQGIQLMPQVIRAPASLAAQALQASSQALLAS
jgi:hypothetical protein